jgi:hypothetical protein
MNNYADMLAKTYSIIRIALDRSGDDLEIIVPLSDDEIGAEVILTATSREENYPADILVRSFLSSLARYGSDFSSMYFMLESDGKPNVWTGTTSIVENMTADDCDDFINMVNNLSKKYEELSDEILFCWFPSSNLSAHELIDIYTYNYNFLACTSGVRNYVVSLFEREETVEVGGAVSVAENYMLSTLKSTYKYIDTNNNEKVSASVLESMEKDSWKEMIEGYSSEKTVKRILFEKDVVYSLPDGTVGSYKMWDFSFANGTGGWTKSDGCVSLSVYTRSDFESRALTAVLQLGTEKINGADFGSILYHAPESLLMRDISAVSFDVLIPSGTYGDLFEIIVTVGSDIAVSESTGIVKSGETTSIYADISALERVQYIKIGIRALDGAAESTVDMCINSISIHSQKYNSEELENIVLSGEIIDKTEGSKTETDEK